MTCRRRLWCWLPMWRRRCRQPFKHPGNPARGLRVIPQRGLHLPHVLLYFLFFLSSIRSDHGRGDPIKRIFHPLPVPVGERMFCCETFLARQALKLPFPWNESKGGPREGPLRHFKQHWQHGPDNAACCALQAWPPGPVAAQPVARSARAAVRAAARRRASAGLLGQSPHNLWPPGPVAAQPVARSARAAVRAAARRCFRRWGRCPDSGPAAARRWSPLRTALAKVSKAEAQRGSNGEWQKRTVKGLLPAACHGGENPCNQCR